MQDDTLFFTKFVPEVLIDDVLLQLIMTRINYIFLSLLINLIQVTLLVL